MTKPPAIQGVYHFAFPCRDAEETRAFYEDLLGLPLVHTMQMTGVPGTDLKVDYAHFFFEMGDGSYIAFFDFGPGEIAPTPRMQHFAMKVATVADVMAFKARLEAAGVPIVGPVDHGFITSFYFHDPNGLELEITARTHQEGFLEEVAAEAHDLLEKWKDYRAETFGPA
jgi:catechol 2,3-dioxygenase-like lactoylglutathione lyase family enzyme